MSAVVTVVRPSEFDAWLDHARSHGEPLVLDVREPHELARASIQADGFSLRAIPMGSIPAHIAALDPQQPIACLCHHGARSMQVAQFLLAHGFEHVTNIAGGIHAWASERDPSVALY